ncbi:hypothetical protein [Sphingosinicella sp. BN140058]|uniref:hypothetical protein n=1 Tax=Sphingosinicella sp. BN140058 TaxID=1892855 RepID=UPI0010103F1E|nr:hypothetical protein [Sphingosinicella sp. BN140058]QAY78847.1 hypothetical protein ETR14_21635 [Sphingosinicella sp. BN140058]
MTRFLNARRSARAGAIMSLALAAGVSAHDIKGTKGNAAKPDFDIVHTSITRAGDDLVFSMAVSGKAGASRPTPSGKLAGSSVYSYVWPTSLNSGAIGFEEDQGILAFAVTSHPDFDDTPLYDENGDGDKANDGNLWHSHWVVLVPDESCGKGALKIRDIEEGAKPRLPSTWPGLPILIDSPAYKPDLAGARVVVRVPAAALGDTKDIRFDGVTAGLRINASVHAPLACVADVFDIASGDLSLPGRVMK